MRTLKILLLIFLGGSLLIVSCKKEDLLSTPNNEPTNIVDTPTQNPYLTDKGVDDYLIAQNYLFRIINIALTQAFLTPELGGFHAGDLAVTRSCPTSSIIDGATNATDTLLIDFGTECLVSNSDGSVDTISGELKLYTFAGIDDTFFLLFDELKCNNTKIKFTPGDISGTSAIKFITSPLNGNVGYSAFIDGAFMNGDALARSRFEVINCTSMDSTIIFPSHSPIPAFNFSTNLATISDPFDPSNNPVVLYNELVEACYSVNPSPFQTLFYDFDGSGYTLTETYNVSKASSEDLMYKPRCRWMFGGSLQYNDIPVDDPNLGTGNSAGAQIPFIDNPFQRVYYGHDGTLDANGNPDPAANDINQCDPFIRVYQCDQFFNGDCVVGEVDRILECD